METQSKPKKVQKWAGRPKDDVIEKRVAEAITALSNKPTVSKTTLHRELGERWGVHWKTVDRIVGRARKEMLARLQRPKEEFRCDSLAFYEAQCNSPKASVAEKVRARQRIDELLGLDEPQRREITGGNGSPLIPTINIESPFRGLSLDMLKEMRELVEASRPKAVVLPDRAAICGTVAAGGNGGNGHGTITLAEVTETNATTQKGNTE